MNDYVEVVLRGTDENVDYDLFFDKLESAIDDKDKHILHDIRYVFFYYAYTYCVVDEDNRYETRVRDYKKPSHFEDCLEMGREYYGED